jgi:hypothetical protein
LSRLLKQIIEINHLTSLYLEFIELSFQRNFKLLMLK